jgi:ABC-2 type transport system permease protein/capsular polysaccharide transport system permease protein
MTSSSLTTTSALPEQSLWQCFKTQCRVVHALFLRELITRYGRHNIGFMWLFAEPMIFTLGIAGLWSLLTHGGHSGIPMAAFILTGYSCLLLWRNVPGRCINALGPSFPLMYHRHVKAVDVFASRIGLELVGASMSFVILSICFISFGIVAPPVNYLTALAGWLLLAWYAASLGLFMGSLSERFDIVEKFWHPAMYLLIPLSGSFFMVDELPKSLQTVVLFIPTVNCTELLREGYLGNQWRWHYDIGYVVSFNMFVMLLGLAQVRYVSRNLSLE